MNDTMYTHHESHFEKKHGIEYWCCDIHRDKEYINRQANKKKKISKKDQE